MLQFEIPPAEGVSTTSFPIAFVRNLSVAADGSGDVYVAVEEHNRVYRATRQGRLYLVAGTETGYSGDGGLAIAARLRGPAAVVVDSFGVAYIADWGNRVIRMVDREGIITTFARVATNVMAIDSAGDLYAGAQNQVLKIASDGSVTTVAGTGDSGFSGDGGPAVSATLGNVTGIAVDGAGNVFITDNSNRVRKVTAGIITTFAGNGFGGYSGDGGPAINAGLSQPRGLAVDGFGNLYIADYFNHMIRRVDPGGVITRVAGTFVGNSPLGSGGYSGDGGPALQAVMKNPIGVAVDSQGTLYIADSNNRRIRRVAADSGVISTFIGNGYRGGGLDTPTRTIAINPSGEVYAAGSGRVVYRVTPAGTLQVFAGTDTFDFAGDGGPATLASFRGPRGLAIDAAGSVYISDTSNNRVRKVSRDGRIVTVVGGGFNGFGGDGGPAVNASLSQPDALAIDAEGSLYIADVSNRRVRKVTPDGIIRTIAGTGQIGFNGDGPAAAASLTVPNGIVIDPSGGIVIADGNRIRKITPEGQINTIAGTGSSPYNGDGPALAVNLAPIGMAFDPEGNLYFADINNNRIRRLTPEGLVQTIAGSTQGYAGDGGPAQSALLGLPSGVAWHPMGALYFNDSLNGAIRRILFEPTARFTVSDLGAASATSPGGASLTVGYASVMSLAGGPVPAGVAVLSSRAGGIAVSETGFAAVPGISSGRVAAEADGPVNTGIAIGNPNDSPAAVSFSFTDGAGDVRSGDFSIAARNQLSVFVTESPFNMAAPFQGTFSFTSSAPLVVSAMRGLVNERSEFLATALPIADLSATPSSAPIAIPHYASGGGWTTRVTLVNPSSQTIAGLLRVTSSSGTDVEEAAYSIPPQALQIVPITVVNAQETGVGRILISPSIGGTPDGFALVSYVDEGVTVASTAVPAVPSSSGFRMFAEIDGDVAAGAPGSAQTGVAIANTSDAPVRVTITIGPQLVLFPTPDDRFELTISANGQFAAFLKDILPKRIPVGPLQSVLRVQATGPVSAVALRTTVNERGELLVSTTPTIDEERPAVPGPLYFPVFADSESFVTRFVLFGAQNAVSHGVLRFFSRSGQSVTLIP